MLPRIANRAPESMLRGGRRFAGSTVVLGSRVPAKSRGLCTGDLMSNLMALIPSVIHWRRHVLAIVAAMTAVSLIGAVAPDITPPTGAAPESLAGQLLI